MKQVWLIGGTQESASIAEKLVANSWPCVVTVTTQSAIALYPDSDLITVKVGALSREEMERLIETKNIDRIVDASHPYAVEISESAIALSQQFHLPYLRYERPQVTEPDNQQVITLDSFKTLINGDYLTQQRVLLTVGYKALPQFQSWHEQATLFARILPSVLSVEKALAAGFTQKQLIALRPPVSYQLEKALCEQWEISLIVSKASGKAGGEDTKKAVAKALNIPLILIRRPEVVYPQKTDKLENVVNFCHE
ncbi:cobalt-precorrin-6A reductase [Euhalothece natronophila Z-M001]|uniref:Cobalt-precorrin-6A reductase n=1 Tax=Euhalothece natronophila Z-M001 TaxID=522448 RepID=A0A5B8NSU0_9CHRO|nr:cobalt-precorrin-6A reductase [Euhalothece natronophila]QDZ41375.1 cobalt-precorrin-6A reductase [Euhalothece natronophila Z-M001]